MGSGRRSSRKRSSPSPSPSSLKIRRKKTTKKRSQERRKKKSRSYRDKSRRRYSGDNSASTSYVSYSASDDDHRSRRRGRSPAIGDTKARKRRAERSLSRSPSSEDTRRRRKSKRRKDTSARKKRREKKQRREPSVDSVSSPSRSCSMRGSSDHSAERNERTMVRPENLKRDENEMGKGISKTSYRSRSCSVSSHYDSESAKNDRRAAIENQPKRLRSVITVVHRASDEVKDEIVYEHDDYPSCRSNDSNDGGGAKDPAVDSKFVKLKEMGDAREERGASEAFISKSPGKGLPSQKLGDEVPSSPRAVEDSDLLKEKKDETRTSGNAGMREDDLEAVLRQKALENLRKFRGRAKIHGNEKENHDKEVKKLTDMNTVSVLDKSNKERSAGHASLASISQNVGSIIAGRHYDVFVHKAGMDLDATTDKASEPVAAKQDTFHLPSRKESANEPPPTSAIPSSRKQVDEHHPKMAQSVADPHGKKPVAMSLLGKSTISDHAKDQTIVRMSTPNQEPFQTNETLKRPSATQGSSNQRMSNPLKRALSDAAKSIHSVPEGSKAIAAEGTPSVEISTKSQSSVGQSTNDGPKERDGSSQFQQKTMSVMRGGELVQVNYKVYIPKNAPALARRQLKR